MIACTRCEALQETKDKQLKVKAGFRAIHCQRCGKQERVAQNKCSCGTIWHHCTLHRIDPLEHRAKKGIKRKANGTNEDKRKIKQLSSARKAPIVEERAQASHQTAQRTRQKKRSIENATKPNQDILERVRARCEKRKAEEAEERLKPSKQVCEREERIAEFQLKAYWQCYPLLGDMSSTDGGKEENDAAEQTITEVQQIHKGSERKQLLARLKGSIEESIKRRKTEELPQMQVNSNSGEDQKEPDL